MYGFGPLSSLPISTIPPTPPVPPPVFFPSVGALPTQLQKTIKSYLYLEYNDDDDLQAFVAAYNAMAQQYITWFDTINLPVYTRSMINGALLDWVAQGLYGSARPVLPSGRAQVIGPYNTFAYNKLPYNQRKLVGSVNYYATSDDIFKRIITWNFFKGDGTVFNIRYLKRRIMRFLIGVNGTNPNVDNTYQISVTFGIANQVNIRILNGLRSVTGGAIFNRFAFNKKAYNQVNTKFVQFAPLVTAPILAAAIRSGACQMPFQFQYLITIENAPQLTGFFNDGGVLVVGSAEGYPSTSAGLPPGAVWSNAGAVSVVPGIVPDPLAPPIYFASTSPTGLSALGGGNLPLTSGLLGSTQLWNNGGEIAIS